MTAIERFALKVFAALLALVGAWFWHTHAVSSAREEGDKAGYDRALAAGQAKYESERERNRKVEGDLREANRLKDVAAATKEQTYAENLNAAQRRMRAGTDSLRCPSASPVQAGASPADRPDTSGPSFDESGAGVMPEVAADILGLAADSARLVRKFDRLAERYDACRALNNGALSESSGAPGE